jgi:transcriptional regulator with GAF, ATPase, and Fis domain
LVCVYAVLVLVYVFATPDIGLRSAFDTSVKRFDGTSLPAITLPSDHLQAEDTIVALGGARVKTWPNLLHALNNLRDRSRAKPVESLAAAERTGQCYVQADGGLLVRVDFERAEPQTGTRQAFTTWCRVRYLPPEEWIPSVVWFILKLGLFTVGALVYWKRPTDPSATQFFLLCIVTLGAYMGGYHWSLIAGQLALILVFMVCSVLLPAVLLHFCVIFPRPKNLLQRYPRRTLLAIYGVPLGFLAVIALSYFRARWMNLGGASDEEVNAALVHLREQIYVYLGVAVFWYLACVACLWHSYRSASDATQRNQVKWIMFGSLVALGPIGVSLSLVAFKPNDFSAGAATPWMFAASICFTTAFTISITRYRLMQLDQIVTSGMVYFVISFLVGLVYYTVVFIATLVVGSQSGPPLAQVLPVSTTALVLMLVLDFVRSRFKKELDRRFHREKYQLDRTLRRMGQAIEQLVDPPTLAKQLLQVSAEVLAVPRGAVYLREGTPPLYRLVDALGAPPPLTELSSGCPLVEAMLVQGTTVVPAGRGTGSDPVQRQLRFLGGEVAHALTHEGELLALLVLGPRDMGGYGTEDLNLLAAFTQLTALALKSAERNRTIDGLNRELQTKVEKISEQQRRILALQSQLMRQTAPSEAAAPAPSAPGGIIGSSPAVQELLQLVKKVSASQSAVLIRGESGTGKELLARALHESSPRAGKAFVQVHCAALSPGLLESELFGHVKGAFTTAYRDKVGRFELANGGTLFLDEVGDISWEVQTKLLRVLQEQTFERVGSSDPVQVDVRIIAATHQNLEQLIAENRFREDLYYRLNVISIRVPPLRERREDIPELAAHFLKVHAQRSGRGVVQIDDDALALLKSYYWPGNIRQLENALQRAVVMADGPEITDAELPVELVKEIDKTAEQFSPAPNGEGLGEVLGVKGERDERDRRERERLVRALAAAKGNKAEAARALGLHRSTLVSRLKKHGLS